MRENKEHLIREVVSLIGTLISTFPGVQFGPLHFRSLEHDKMGALKWNGGDYEAKMVLSPESLEESSWWVANGDSCMRKITGEEPHSILETDASLTGWGAKRGDMKTQGVWSRSEKGQRIKCLELLSVRWGCRWNVRWNSRAANGFAALILIGCRDVKQLRLANRNLRIPFQCQRWREFVLAHFVVL